MTEKNVRCDKCGKPALEIHYDFTRDPDGAGGMENNYSTVDLCHEHAVAALQDFLQKPAKYVMVVAKAEFSKWVRSSKWKPNAV